MASSAPQPPMQPFTPPQIAKLQPHAYLLSHLSPTSSGAKPIRPDGRRELQSRSPTIHTGSLTHANGSAVVRLGRTTVVCGVRAEILRADEGAGWRVSHNQTSAEDVAEKTTGKTGDNKSPADEDNDDDGEISTLNLLVPNIELNTGCSPAFLPGGPPSTIAQSLSARLLSLLQISRMIRASDLRIYGPIEKGVERDDNTMMMDEEEEEDNAATSDAGEQKATEIKAFWTLYIDITVLSHSGSLFDAISLATIAALRETILPATTWDVDEQRVLCDPAISNANKLDLRCLPISCSFAVFEENERGRDISIRGGGGNGAQQQRATSWLLADPDSFEEELCKETITVVVYQDRILKLEKSGGGAIGVREMKVVMRTAVQRYEELKTILKGGFK